jgi:hypothetical protein
MDSENHKSNTTQKYIVTSVCYFIHTHAHTPPPPPPPPPPTITTRQVVHLFQTSDTSLGFTLSTPCAHTQTQFSDQIVDKGKNIVCVCVRMSKSIKIC